MARSILVVTEDAVEWLTLERELASRFAVLRANGPAQAFSLIYLHLCLITHTFSNKSRLISVTRARTFRSCISGE